MWHFKLYGSQFRHIFRGTNLGNRLFGLLPALIIIAEARMPTLTLDFYQSICFSGKITANIRDGPHTRSWFDANTRSLPCLMLMKGQTPQFHSIHSKYEPNVCPDNVAKHFACGPTQIRGFVGSILVPQWGLLRDSLQNMKDR